MLTGSLFARLPSNRRLAGSQMGRRKRAGLDRAFPAWSEARRDRVFVRLLSCDFVNRVVFRFHNAFPRLATIVARAVRVSRNRAIDELIASDSPMIVAGGHLGPVFFQVLVLRLILTGRTVYTLHAERGSHRSACVAFMRKIGIEPVLDDPMATRTLLKALRSDARPAIIVAFDHLAVGTRMIPFLGTEVPVSDGVAYLADQTDTPVVTAISTYDRGFLSMVLEGPFRIDRSLPAQARREAFVDGLYRILERYVSAAPEQWSEWQYLAPDVQ